MSRVLLSIVAVAGVAGLAGVALGLVGSADASFPDPIGPAARGLMQCHQPDTARRTCNSMAAYARAKSGGGFENTAFVLVRPSSPTVVMRTVTRVEVREGAVCGRILERDIAAAQFLVDDRVPGARQEQALRRAMIPATAAMCDHEICTSYTGSGESLVSSVVVDGIPKPSANQDVIWVQPSDGWRVGS